MSTHGAGFSSTVRAHGLFLERQRTFAISSLRILI